MISNAKICYLSKNCLYAKFKDLIFSLSDSCYHSDLILLFFSQNMHWKYSAEMLHIRLKDSLLVHYRLLNRLYQHKNIKIFGGDLWWLFLFWFFSYFEHDDNFMTFLNIFFYFFHFLLILNLISFRSYVKIW